VATIAFDVDDTLIKYEDGKERPNRELIQVLVYLYAMGNKIIVWSGGGKDYAEMWTRRLFIDHIVTCQEKPLLGIGKDGDELGPTVVDIAFDDQVVHYGKVNLKA
jgi:predicted HAD superfamily phosphohydrolase YqeG